jgi:hypothetical protein
LQTLLRGEQRFACGSCADTRCVQGPDAKVPGYDLGSFWARSGLAFLTHGAGQQLGHSRALHSFPADGVNNFNQYPVGLGDTTAGLNLGGSPLLLF